LTIPHIDYDVIVVGAGPAGLATGKTLGEKGLNCLVVERSDEIGFPVRTSGASWIDEMEALGIPSSCFNPVSNISFVAPKEEAKFHFEKPIACILDVTELNKFLASKAIQSGATLKMHSEVKNAFQSEGLNYVELEIDGKVEKLCCKVIVDASGLNATVVRKFGLLKSWERIGLGVQYDIESSNIDVDWAGLFVGSEIIPSGYGWLFPWKKNRARVGVGVIRPDSLANPIAYIQSFMDSKKLGVKDNYFVIKREVGVFPCSGPIETSIADGFLAVGDAAGQGSPLHGEGIRYAIQFGILAGDVISGAIQGGDVSKKALSLYERSWRKEVGLKFRVALEIQKRISKYQDNQWDTSVKYLKQIGDKDPELIVQLFKTNFSRGNIWRVFKQSPSRAVKYLTRSI
jgi:digeranylgeranylglycerophospholipid reductase